MEDVSTKLRPEQVTAILRRVFGNGFNPRKMQELGGGTFNETYLVDVSEKESVVLRVAPPPAANSYWDDVALMRREHNILPYFASMATLMPKTIFVDFTHQIVARDYSVQTFMEGDRWSDIEDELTLEENVDLWRQCGEIVKQIHNTTGEQFGYPYPGMAFTKWHDVISDRFSKIAQSLKNYHIEIPDFSTVSEIVNSTQSVFNDVHTPHLLHGDLWTFNLLVTRKNNKPVIAGVLDAERAWWGDPLADWIMFLLSIRSGETQWQHQLAAFNTGYGAPEKGGSLQFRQEVYKAMHVGSSAVWAAKHGSQADIKRARQDLNKIARLLPALL